MAFCVCCIECSGFVILPVLLCFMLLCGRIHALQWSGALDIPAILMHETRVTLVAFLLDLPIEYFWYILLWPLWSALHSIMRSFKVTQVYVRSRRSRGQVFPAAALCGLAVTVTRKLPHYVGARRARHRRGHGPRQAVVPLRPLHTRHLCPHWCGGTAVSLMFVLRPARVGA